MSVSLPALPALVAGRALKADAVASAQRALEQVRQLLASYDLTCDVMKEIPHGAREAVAAALARRLAAADRMARHCQERLDEAAGFCASLTDAPSPVAMVKVPGPFYEMLSPYIDDAMGPVLAVISHRVGAGCTAQEVEAFFPKPRPALAA